MPSIINLYQNDRYENNDSIHKYCDNNINSLYESIRVYVLGLNLVVVII